MRAIEKIVTSMSAPVAHIGGVSFAGTNVLVPSWVESWDGQHPLLDIGCGNCNNAMAALDHGTKVYATEMVESTLLQLQAEHAGVKNLSFHFLHLPNQVPFQDNSFSGILCSEVFHFLDHAEVIATVWELHRLLITGGKAVITCACEDAAILHKTDIKKRNAEGRKHSPLKLPVLYDVLPRMNEALETYGVKEEEREEAIQFYRDILPTPYFNYFNAEQLAMVFERTGFAVETVSTGPAPQFPLFVHGDHDQVRLVARKK